MPDMLAHWEVAEKARARLRPGPLARLLDSQPDAYKVGAQGPDFLFYSRVWSGGRSRRYLAFLVHQHRMRDVFHSLFDQAAGLPAEERAIALAFACGYAAHLCLDAEAHPWIMYWTGDITERADPEKRALAFRRHGLLEGSIDVMLRQQRSADPTATCSRGCHVTTRGRSSPSPRTSSGWETDEAATAGVPGGAPESTSPWPSMSVIRWRTLTGR